MFDNYLKKEIFQWEKINKVLRLKTVQLDRKCDEMNKSVGEKYSSSTKSNYKFNLVGHSGRLSE